jgi:hypothetical protein
MIFRTLNQAKFLSFLILIILFTSCTITKPKNPDFNVEMTDIDSTLNTFVISESKSLSGSEISKNGQVSSQLEIQIVNGVSIPSDEASLKALSEKIASYLKSELKNKNDFNVFNVLFISEKTETGITTTNSIGWIFKNEELK